MSLKNETNQAFHNTRNFYREYVRDMTPERIGQEFQDDSRRLAELYYDAVGATKKDNQKEKLPVQIFRLLSALISRMTPARRLAFGLSIAGLVVHLLMSGPVASLMLPVSIIALILLLLLELLEKSDVKKEIDLARDIQISLLPGSNLHYQNLEFASFASTASDVGGDYIDIISKDHGTYYIIADVAGKGLSAALYMIRLQALVHVLIENFKPGPKELLLQLNNYIKSGNRDRTFVTACIVFFPVGNTQIQLCRAGHNPPLLYQSDRSSVIELRPEGLALGMASQNVLEKHLRELSLYMKPGDTLLFYTDGLTEARNTNKEQYDEFRLRHLFELYASRNATTVMHKIQLAVEEFIQGERLADDITFTCVQLHAEKHPGFHPDAKAAS